MDKYTRDMKLREERTGINGVTLVPRKSIPRTKRTIESEEYKGPGSGDLRKYPNFGAIIPIEDYRISGEGREPIVIREVATDAKGMRKYALLDYKKDSEYANVRYVYSEGIEIEKMVEDAEYAETVIRLLQEERLEEKEEESYKLNSDIVYIGTVTKTENGYVKAAAEDYAATILQIESSIEERKQESKRMYGEITRPEEQEERKKKIRESLRICDDDDLAYIVATILTGEQSKDPEFVKKVKECKEEIENEKSSESSLDENDGDGEPEQ